MEEKNSKHIRRKVSDFKYMLRTYGLELDEKLIKDYENALWQAEKISPKEEDKFLGIGLEKQRKGSYHILQFNIPKIKKEGKLGVVIEAKWPRDSSPAIFVSAHRISGYSLPFAGFSVLPSDKLLGIPVIYGRTNFPAIYFDPENTENCFEEFLLKKYKEGKVVIKKDPCKSSEDKIVTQKRIVVELSGNEPIYKAIKSLANEAISYDYACSMSFHMDIIVGEDNTLPIGFNKQNYEKDMHILDDLLLLNAKAFLNSYSLKERKDKLSRYARGTPFQYYLGDRIIEEYFRRFDTAFLSLFGIKNNNRERNIEKFAKWLSKNDKRLPPGTYATWITEKLRLFDKNKPAISSF